MGLMTKQPETVQEWMEFHRQARVAEGMSLATQAMVNALAERVVIDRASRANIIGVTSSGRIITELVGEASEAELKWEEIRLGFEASR